MHISTKRDDPASCETLQNSRCTTSVPSSGGIHQNGTSFLFLSFGPIWQKMMTSNVLLGCSTEAQKKMTFIVYKIPFGLPSNVKHNRELCKPQFLGER